MQGYNAQAVTNEHQVVLAAEIETVGADFGHLEPMLDVTQRELEAAGIDELPGVLLADPGYWHGEQMQRIGDHGIQVLIPPDTGRRRTTRRNRDGGRYDEMRQVLASDHGSELYRERQPMAGAVRGPRPDEPAALALASPWIPTLGRTRRHPYRASLRMVLSIAQAGARVGFMRLYVCGPRGWSEFRREPHWLRRAPLFRF